MLPCFHWVEFAKGYLKTNPVVGVGEFEQILLEHFAPEMTQTHEQNLRGKKRQRKENLTDHVKANLTKQGLIKYIFGFIVHTPNGQPTWEGLEQVCWMVDRNWQRRFDKREEELWSIVRRLEKKVRQLGGNPFEE